MDTLDKIISEELRFENLKYKSISALQVELDTLYQYLLMKTEGKLSYGQKNSLKERIKVRMELLYGDFKENLESELEEQYELFKEKKDSTIGIGTVLAASFLGLSFADMLTKQKYSQINSINKMVNSGQIIKKKVSGKTINAQLYSIARSFSRNGREMIRNKVYTESAVKGWQSVAVLDGKTSVECLGLHNIYYTKEKYGKRENIPNRPPRHFNCRSILVEVGDTKYNSPTLQEFFTNNPDDALDILGKSRFELFKDGRLQFKSFLDVGSSRLFTLDEIAAKI